MKNSINVKIVFKLLDWKKSDSSWQDNIVKTPGISKLVYNNSVVVTPSDLYEEVNNRSFRPVRKFKEARNSFFGLGVYLLKPKFRIEDKL